MNTTSQRFSQSAWQGLRASLSNRGLKAWCLAALVVAPLGAAEWSQWRGPARDGWAPMFQPPSSWPEALETQWKVEVGEGYGAPVVAGDKVFLITRQGEDEVAMAVDLHSGRALWTKRWPTPYKFNEAATAFGKSPRSAPVVADGVACFLGVDARLTCHQASDGNLLWTKDFSERSGSQRNFCGSSLSPLVVDGVLYAHLGDDTGGRLFAAELRTGKELWHWEGQGPSYTSPILVEVDGERQLVTMGAVDLLGLAADSGKLLWRRPFPDKWNQNISTPLQVGETLIFADLENGTLAVWPQRKGDGWELKEQWLEPELTQYMASPVSDGQRVYGFSNRRKGQLFAMEPKTGKVLWQDEGRGGRNAALTLAGEWLLVTSTDSELRVLKRVEEGLQEVQRYEIAQSSVWAHPAWVQDGLLVKDERHLARLRLPASSEAKAENAAP